MKLEHLLITRRAALLLTLCTALGGSLSGCMSSSPIWDAHVGDAVRTDLAAARGLGVDALLIAGGIHDRELLRQGAIDGGALAALFSLPGTPPAVATMPQLVW